MKAVEKAYEAVREGIVSGRYVPGTRITEQEVAAVAGVSRTPVREALRQLNAEGLLEFVPNQGAVVTSWSKQELNEIFDLRAVLESYAAAQAARHADAAMTARLRKLAEQQMEASRKREPGYLVRIKALNDRFHGEIAKAGGNRLLRNILTTLTQSSLAAITFRNYDAESLSRSAAHHLELVAAIEAGDPDWAASVMRSHILAARRVFGPEVAEKKTAS
ncbi:MAG: GntR family transcriptional regulator [Gammaproteobacteria bacterium]